MTNEQARQKICHRSMEKDPVNCRPLTCMAWVPESEVRIGGTGISGTTREGGYCADLKKEK